MVVNYCEVHNNCETDDDTIAAFPELDVVEDYNISLGRTDEPNLQLKSGLVYIKQAKVGGSTFGGVMRRIGKRHGLHHARDGPNWLPQASLKFEGSESVWANHGARHDLRWMLDIDMPNAFTITTVRDPVDRAMSEFYHFKVSRGVMTGSVFNKVFFLNSASVGYQVDNLYYNVPTVADIDQSYDFISVTERFDESLVLLCKYLNISMVDALYLKSKVAGTASTGKEDHGAIQTPHPPLNLEPIEVQAAAARLHGNTPDMQLYKLANERLDREVAKYGDSFERDLETFQQMLAEVERTCRPRFSESCLWNDNGCGQACIDFLAIQEGWSQACIDVPQGMPGCIDVPSGDSIVVRKGS